MTAAPDRTTDDLTLADLLRLATWMDMNPLLTEDEARRELGLPVVPPREIGKHNANSSQARRGMPFRKAF